MMIISMVGTITKYQNEVYVDKISVLDENGTVKEMSVGSTWSSRLDLALDSALFFNDMVILERKNVYGSTRDRTVVRSVRQESQVFHRGISRPHYRTNSARTRSTTASL